MVRYAVPAVGETAAAELSSLLASGLGPQHAALLLDALAAELEPRGDSAVLELVTSGPDIAGTTRDTGVVLRELFAEAERRVLVVGFAVHQGAHSGDCDRPFRPKVITDSGDRDHAVTRPIGSA